MDDTKQKETDEILDLYLDESNNLKVRMIKMIDDDNDKSFLKTDEILEWYYTNKEKLTEYQNENFFNHLHELLSIDLNRGIAVFNLNEIIKNIKID